MPGTNTSASEVTHVSQHGLWLLLADEEVFLPFDQFPWFRRATIDQLSYVEWPSPDHLYWPDLDMTCLWRRFDDQMRFRWCRVPLHSLNIVATDIAPIRSTAHYLRMVTTFEAFLEEAAGDERHPAMGLVDIVGDLIADYESQNASLPEATGVHALKFLMDQHGVKQGELQELGSQGVVSEILAGKRELNIRQVRALAKRFGVSVATFV